MHGRLQISEPAAMVKPGCGLHTAAKQMDKNFPFGYNAFPIQYCTNWL